MYVKDQTLINYLLISDLQTEEDYDFLYIYDGPNDQTTLLDNFNGNLGSFEISSTGNSLFAKFKSDGSVTRKGFLAIIHNDTPIDQIESPNYPETYPNNAYETWIITAPSGSLVKLRFQNFSVSKTPVILQGA